MDEGFLQAIQESPEDDSSRLIYADWLEESGTDENVARAELIRGQIELHQRLLVHPNRHQLEANARGEMERTPGHFSFQQNLSPDLEARDRQLLQMYGEVWAKPYKGLAHGFRRGFVTEIAAPLPEALNSSRELLTSNPVNALQLTTWSVEVPTFSGWPFLPRLSYLSFRNLPLSRADIRKLVFCYRLEKLRELCLWGVRVGESGAEALADTPALSRLERLDLGVAGLRTEGTEVLAGSPLLGRLSWLRLWNNQVGNRGVEMLALSPHLSNLSTLILGDNNITDAGIEALAASASLDSLRSLSLTSNRFTEAGARALARSSHLSRLQHLRVSGAGSGASVNEAGLTVLWERFGSGLEVSLSPCELVPF